MRKIDDAPRKNFATTRVDAFRRRTVPQRSIASLTPPRSPRLKFAIECKSAGDSLKLVESTASSGEMQWLSTEVMPLDVVGKSSGNGGRATARNGFRDPINRQPSIDHLAYTGG